MLYELIMEAINTFDALSRSAIRLFDIFMVFPGHGFLWLLEFLKTNFFTIMSFLSHLDKLTLVLIGYSISLTGALGLIVVYQFFDQKEEEEEEEPKKEQRKLFVVSIEGVPGSGKSHRLQHFSKKLSSSENYIFVEVEEPVKEFVESNWLQIYYQDKKAHGYGFQTFAAYIRLRKFREAIERAERENPDNNLPLVLITERCLSSDAIFVNTLLKLGEMSPHYAKTYFAWCDEWRNVELTRTMNLSHVYVSTSLDKTMQRIKKRDREAEKDYTKEYQNVLIDEHDKFIDKAEINGQQVLRLDGTIDIELDDNQDTDIVDTETESTRAALDPKFQEQLHQIRNFVEDMVSGVESTDINKTD